MEIATADARRLLLQAQGLLDDPERRAGPAAVGKLIERLGFVQLDSINVVERAHHLTLRSRLHGYRPAHLKTLHEKRRALFEHWTHDASTIPAPWLPHWRHRCERMVNRPRVRQWCRRAMGARHARLVKEVRARIEAEGPLRSADFEQARGGGNWWSWKPAKAALEFLWWRGDLCISAREGFQKVYDLTTRAYPEAAARETPPLDRFVEWACAAALERLGVATPAELAGFWGVVTLAEARAWCGDRDAWRCDGRKVVAVADWRTRARRAKRALERLDDRVRLLSPFDPILRDRKRAERLFGFHYRFEAFVPAAKRRYGYYVLPLLRGEELVGRADCKLHRDREELEVKGLWWERGRRDDDAAEAAVARLARFVGAGSHRTRIRHHRRFRSPG